MSNECFSNSQRQQPNVSTIHNQQRQPPPRQPQQKPQQQVNARSEISAEQVAAKFKAILGEGKTNKQQAQQTVLLCLFVIGARVAVIRFSETKAGLVAMLLKVTKRKL